MKGFRLSLVLNIISRMMLVIWNLKLKVIRRFFVCLFVKVLMSGLKMYVSQLAKASSKHFPQTILGPTKHGQTNDLINLNRD